MPPISVSLPCSPPPFCASHERWAPEGGQADEVCIAAYGGVHSRLGAFGVASRGGGDGSGGLLGMFEGCVKRGWCQESGVKLGHWIMLYEFPIWGACRQSAVTQHVT